MEPSAPHIERERLLELYGMNILQTEPDAVLDAFCEKVGKLFDVPTCIVSIVLEDRQWFKSSFGCPIELAQARETPRDISFCTHVVDTGQPLIVREVSKDSRFANNPLVKKHGFGFYVGFPLKTRKGNVLGSLCLYDNKPREFSERDIQLLGLFSERAMAHLELCRELERIRVSEARLSGILDMAYEAIISIDDAQQIILFNKGAEQIFGYSQDEAVGQPIDLLLPERFRTLHHSHIAGFAASPGTARPMGDRREICGRRKNGEEFPAEASISKLVMAGRKIFTVVLRDITERKRVEEALAEQAVRDALTGLYNRRCFNDRIKEEIARAGRNQQILAILLCDLDHFKIINDTQGHHTGDEVLRAVARSIQEASRGADLVFRWGGDEIVVVLSNTTREGALIAAERIRSGIHKIGEKARLNLDLSIGIALCPEQGGSADELIRMADLALYIAKKNGDKIHIGAEDYRLDERSIKVVFQPVVAVQPIRNIRTQQVIGYEALSRDPEGRLSILDLFEKYKGIGKLTELKCICFKTQLKAAQEVGLERVFINVDFNVLSQVELIPKPPGIEVILEISELEAIHDIESRLGIARSWREMGYKFAIDDFGAGFISLPFIARLVPDYIKIDRSTILQAVSSEQFKEFMIGLIFGLKNYATDGIIAEGIETKKELKVAKELGIFLIQGFLLGRPQELKA